MGAIFLISLSHCAMTPAGHMTLAQYASSTIQVDTGNNNLQRRFAPFLPRSHRPLITTQFTINNTIESLDSLPKTHL